MHSQARNLEDPQNRLNQVFINQFEIKKNVKKNKKIVYN